MVTGNIGVKLRKASPLKSVLLVDDKPSFLTLAKLSLRADGRINLHTAQNSTDALEKIKLNPDLVLMDLDLGDNEPTGIELVANLRQQGFIGVINIITGDADPKKLSEAITAGANGYFVKGEAIEGSFRDQVTRLLFAENNSRGGWIASISSTQPSSTQRNSVNIR